MALSCHYTNGNHTNAVFKRFWVSSQTLPPILKIKAVKCICKYDNQSEDRTGDNFGNGV
jgi:hypothetical protein